MKDIGAGNGADRNRIAVSGPDASPMGNILKKCLLVVGAAVVVMLILALIFSDKDAVASLLLGSALVIVFFGLSLFVGHLVGKRLPEAVMGAFVMTYFVKVAGFAAVLFTLGTPTWLDKTWFAVAALVCVLVWQAVEVVVFSRQRFLFFDDTQPDPTTPKDEDL